MKITIVVEVVTMWLPFRRRGERDARAESRRVHRLERAQHEQEISEVLESEYARADLDNATLRVSGMSRSGADGLLGGGGGFRRRARETLRDEGYDGD
jgi:hypothetical protein